MSNYEIWVKDISKIDKNIKIVFITSEFNSEYTKSLENINEEILMTNWFKNIKKFLVSWAYEIPAFINKVNNKLKPDLILCFWVIIRWETTHYDMVAWESARWIMNISLENDSSTIINGILTCENIEQVKARISDTYAISGLNLLVEIDKLW